MLPKGSPHAVQPCLAHSFIRPSKMKNLSFRGAARLEQGQKQSPEKEKSFV